jgi:hypothetical protein
MSTRTDRREIVFASGTSLRAVEVPCDFRLAVHEAGHVVARALLGMGTDWACAVPTMLDDMELDPATSGYQGLPAETLFVALAGSVAEKLWAGESPFPWTIKLYGGGDIPWFADAAERIVAAEGRRAKASQPLSRPTKGKDLIFAMNAAVVEAIERPAAWSTVSAVASALSEGVILDSEELSDLTLGIARTISLEELQDLVEDVLHSAV